MRRRLAMLMLGGAVIARVAVAEPSELERLRAENARLQARVTALEAENARLERRGTTPLAAALEQTAAASIQVTFDPAADMTTIATTPSQLARLDGSRVRQWITLRAERPGEHPSGPAARVQLVIETVASTGAFRSARVLGVSVDGVVSDLPVVDYRSEAITTARDSIKTGERERIVVAVPLDVLGRMAAGRDVQGTLGSASFRLTPEQLATVQAFEKRLSG